MIVKSGSLSGHSAPPQARQLSNGMLLQHQGDQRLVDSTTIMRR
jgi:hypothetical protein